MSVFISLIVLSAAIFLGRIVKIHLFGSENVYSFKEALAEYPDKATRMLHLGDCIEQTLKEFRLIINFVKTKLIKKSEPEMNFTIKKEEAKEFLIKNGIGTINHLLPDHLKFPTPPGDYSLDLDLTLPANIENNFADGLKNPEANLYIKPQSPTPTNTTPATTKKPLTILPQKPVNIPNNQQTVDNIVDETIQEVLMASGKNVPEDVPGEAPEIDSSFLMSLAIPVDVLEEVEKSLNYQTDKIHPALEKYAESVKRTKIALFRAGMRRSDVQKKFQKQKQKKPLLIEQI